MSSCMWNFLLTLILLNKAESAPSLFSLIGPNGPVSAPVGSSVTLPCALSPSFSAVPLQVRWYRPDAFGTPVLLYEEHQVQTKTVDPLYQGRASLVGDLEKGEVFLRLTNLTLSDRGQYVCFAKSTKWYSDLYISLTVKVIGSVPVVWYVDGGRGQVNVTCESEGWFPEPTLTWRDRRGTEISSNSSDVCLFTDEEGLMGVGSWLLFSPSQSEWLSCSVGLSDQETTESRVALHTRTAPPSVCTNGSWKDPLIIIFFLILLAGAICFAVYHRKDIIRFVSSQNSRNSTESGSAKNLKHPDPPAATDESTPLNDCNEEKADVCNVPVHLQLERTADAAENKDSVTTMEVVVIPDLGLAQQHYVNLTLDMETVPPFLKVQDKYTSIYCPDSQKVSLPETHFLHADPLKGLSGETAHPHALCDRCFSSGKHYWEVQVGGHSKQSWYVGVCTIDPVQKQTVSLQPENGFWILRYEKATGLFVNTQTSTKVPVKELFKTVGVFLDCDQHTLTFYNADNNLCLCHLYVAPNVAFIPLISPGVREQEAIQLCHRQNHQDPQTSVKLTDLKPPKEYWVNLLLNPATVPAGLKVDETRTQIFCPKPVKHLGPSRELPYALCDNAFSTGKHYWEVNVGKHKLHWYVGVCTSRADQTQRVHRTPQNGFWVFYYNKTGLFANTKPQTQLHLTELFEVLGVFLDCDEHTLTFYNVDSNVALWCFHLPPNKRLIPLLSPGEEDTEPIFINPPANAVSVNGENKTNRKLNENENEVKIT